jgi:hypothetical protein
LTVDVAMLFVLTLAVALVLTSEAACPSQLLVEPRVLTSSGQRARVSWEKIPRREGDRIGVFDGTTGKHLFTERNVTSSETSHEFTLYNMRRMGYLFRYLRASGEVVARSDIVSFELGDDEPTQLHMALTENPAALSVMWVTSRPDPPLVDFGTTPGEFNVSASGTSHTYAESDFCEKTRIWQEPGFMHEVLLTGLSAGTRYYFRYGI